jgi:ClpP class serine protease
MALCRHPGKVTVFVPHYAMSGGTLLALAADEIVMDDNAVLGPVDPSSVNGLLIPSSRWWSRSR